MGHYFRERFILSSAGLNERDFQFNIIIINTCKQVLAEQMDSTQSTYTLYDPNVQTNPEEKEEKPLDKIDWFVNECTSFNFSNFDKKKQVTLGKYDPEKKHMTVGYGLNLKGKCNNTKCNACTKSKQSWIQKGYGTFEIGSARFKNQCQSCGSKIPGNSIKTLGFLKAKVKIEGVKQDGDQEIPYQAKLIEKDGKLVYFTDYDEDIIKWSYLTLTVTKL